MKKNNFLKISFVFFILISINYNCTSTKDFSNTQNREVYFINIMVQKKINKEYNSEYYVLTPRSLKPITTKLKSYEKKLWRNMGRGYALAVGPFSDFHEASRAAQFYKGDSIKMDELYISDPAFKKDAEVYWFQLKVNIRERSGSYYFERIPAIVGRGNYETFVQIFEAGIQLGENITIGPFMNYEDAEEAKRYYRLQSN